MHIHVHPPHTYNNIQMVDLLMSALFCLVNLSWEATQSPLAVKSAPLMITFVASETTLRLISHCWEELSKVSHTRACVCSGSYRNKKHQCVCCRLLPEFFRYALFQLIRLLSANEFSTIICSNGIWFNVPLDSLLIA